MERVAKPLRIDGGAHRDPRGAAAGADPRRRAAAGHRLCAADGQRAGEVRAAAGRRCTREGHTSVTEPAPTRDHTERMLRGFGVAARRATGARGARRAAQPLRGCAIEVPGDFSSAAFFLVAGCLAAERGPHAARRRASTRRAPVCCELLRMMGADIACEPARRGRGRADRRYSRARQRAARHPRAGAAGAAGDR